MIIYVVYINWFRWSVIAARLPGRTDNEIKNYWNTYIKRKLIGRGIDPQNHSPINHVTTLESHPAVVIQTMSKGVANDIDEAATEKGGKERDSPLELDLNLSIGLPHCSPAVRSHQFTV